MPSGFQKGKTTEYNAEKIKKVYFDSLPTNDLSKISENPSSEDSIVPKTVQLFLNLLNNLIEIERSHGNNLQTFFKIGLFDKKEKNDQGSSLIEENDYINLNSLNEEETTTLLRYQPHKNILAKRLFHLPSWEVFFKAITHIGILAFLIKSLKIMTLSL